MAKKKKAKKKAKKKTKKAGRPKKEFSDEVERKIKQMALDNCHVDTIGMALGIAKNTLIRHFGTFITQKRAHGRTDLRRTQRKLAKKNPAMAIFLGKNELGQKDKQEHEHGITNDLTKLLGLIDGSSKGKLPDRKEAKDVRE